MILAYKHSGKPFKSTFKINTIKGEIVNPNTGLPAWTFEEDDSVVDQRTCVVVNMINLDQQCRALCLEWERACPAQIHAIRNRCVRLGFLWSRLARKEEVHLELLDYMQAVQEAIHGDWGKINTLHPRR